MASAGSLMFPALSQILIQAGPDSDTIVGFADALDAVIDNDKTAESTRKTSTDVLHNLFTFLLSKLIY
jgi:hypothetical protein